MDQVSQTRKLLKQDLRHEKEKVLFNIATRGRGVDYLKGYKANCSESI